jgi:putative transposase
MQILTQKVEIFPELIEVNRKSQLVNQKDLIERMFGMRRFFFNRALIELKTVFGPEFTIKHSDKKPNKNFIMSLRKDLFRDTPKYKALLDTVPFHIMDNALEDLKQAVYSCKSKMKWKKGKGLDKTNKNRLRKGKIPILNTILLRKKKNSNTCRIHRCGYNKGIRVENQYLILPHLKGIKISNPLRWNGTIKSVTLTKAGIRYFASITMEVSDEEIKKYEKTNKHIAFDWGIKTFMTGYDGKDILNLEFDKEKLKGFNSNIARKQKSLSSKRRFSKAWSKAKTKLEYAYMRRENYQDDSIKIFVNYLAQHYDSITLEDLSMGFVMKNRKLARSATQHPYYKFKIFAYNKFKQTDKKVYLVPHTFPSSQICSSCGHQLKNDEKLKLGNDTYNCPNCNSIHNRDENAAINIYNCPDKTLFSGY